MGLLKSYDHASEAGGMCLDPLTIRGSELKSFSIFINFDKVNCLLPLGKNLSF